MGVVGQGNAVPYVSSQGGEADVSLPQGPA